MLTCKKIFVKEFKDINMKKAYLKCCKWYSSNILAVNNSNNILHKIEKIEKKEYPSVRLTLFVYVDEEEVKERHCMICREVSGAFFMKQNKYMCESCKMPPYRKRIEGAIENICNAVKGVISFD